MDRVTGARILCIMGSGETAPTMSPVHRDLIERVGGTRARAVLLDTPFGFQENADELVARAQEHFERSIGHPLELASLRRVERASEVEREAAYSRIHDADYLFSGPGSPSYTLRQWRDTEVPGLLREKLERGGCVTLASAAAITLGVVSLPVYEIYKVGEPVHWLEGLDLLSAAGIRAALITHWDNAEGGTHDTRFCYMGEVRLSQLESLLPEGAAILGVDEHTALILDLAAGRVEVRGRGRAVVRRGGLETALPSGSEISLGELQAMLSGAGVSAARPPATDVVEVAPEPPDQQDPFPALLAERQEEFDRARDARDVEAMVAAILAVETALDEWSGETFSSDERERGRALLRRMVTRLGELATEGAADPRERVAPFVEAILALRRQFRAERRFEDADRLRDLLTGCGIEVRDGHQGEGSGWELSPRAGSPEIVEQDRRPAAAAEGG
jgi:cyanophycinase-like exopeptidase